MGLKAKKAPQIIPGGVQKLGKEPGPKTTRQRGQYKKKQMHVINTNIKQ